MSMASEHYFPIFVLQVSFNCRFPLTSLWGSPGVLEHVRTCTRFKNSTSILLTD